MIISDFDVRRLEVSARALTALAGHDEAVADVHAAVEVIARAARDLATCRHMQAAVTAAAAMGGGAVTQPKPVAIPGAVPVRPLVERALVGTLTKAHPQLPAIRALLDERTAKGVETYGAALAAPNGRDFLRDAIEEAADLVQYIAGLRHLAGPPGAVSDAAHIDRLRTLHALVAVAYNEVTNELRRSEPDVLPW